MASFKTSCPHCGQECTVQNEWIGKNAECPGCQNTFVIQAPKSKIKEITYGRNKMYFSNAQEQWQAKRKEAIALTIAGIFLTIQSIVICFALLSALEKFVPAIIPVIIPMIVTGIVVGVIGFKKLKIPAPIIPTDAEISKQIKIVLDNFTSHAVKCFGTDEEPPACTEPLLLWGFDYSVVVELGKDLVARPVRGKDGVLRSPVISMHYFVISKEMIHHYFRHESLISSSDIREETEEIYYSDVVTVRSFTERKCQTFVLTTSGGTDIQCGGTDIQCSAFDTKSVEKAVNVIRTLIKQKKTQK